MQHNRRGVSTPASASRSKTTPPRAGWRNSRSDPSLRHMIRSASSTADPRQITRQSPAPASGFEFLFTRLDTGVETPRLQSCTSREAGFFASAELLRLSESTQGFGISRYRIGFHYGFPRLPTQFEREPIRVVSIAGKSRAPNKGGPKTACIFLRLV